MNANDLKEDAHKQHPHKEHHKHAAHTPHNSGIPAYQVVSSDLLEKLSKSGETASQLQDAMLRARADFDNFRKRLSKERDEAIKFANEGLITELLPAIDNLELGLKAAGTSPETKSITQGLNMVLGQFIRILSENGVKTIEAEGKPFDPNFHEAVGHQPSTEAKEGTVITQTRKGYTLHERLLRPASVIVAQAPATNSKA